LEDFKCKLEEGERNVDATAELETDGSAASGEFSTADT
jgi:hypothetical protein